MNVSASPLRKLSAALLPLFGKKAKNRALTALDFGAEGVSVATISRDNGAAPRLTLCEFHRGDGPRAQGKLLGPLAKRLGLDKSPCATLFSLGSYRSLLIDAPEVPPNELRAALHWQVKDQIDFSVEDAVIDAFPLPPMRGRPKPMYVAVARMSDLEQKIEWIRDTGVDLDIVDIPELALRNIAALLPEQDTGVMLLYLSPLGGQNVLVRQTVLYLARYLDIRPGPLWAASAGGTAAEGGSQPAPDHLSNIVSEIQRSLDYYANYFQAPPLSGLMVCPMAIEGITVASLVEYLRKNLTVPVNALDLNRLLTVSKPLTPELQARALLAIGAALRVDGGPKASIRYPDALLPVPVEGS